MSSRYVKRSRALAAFAFAAWLATPHLAQAQLTDLTQTPNIENAGIRKSLQEQVGAGVGDVLTPGSSTYIIARDPARSIRRGRQLFQRKFTLTQGFGPAYPRWHRRHRCGGRHRRGPDRELRGLSWPTTRLRRFRRRCRDATRQSRCSAPVRPRPPGDARRRDHVGPARNSRTGERGGQAAPCCGDPAALEQGNRIRCRSASMPTVPWTPPGSGASIRICACGRSSRTAARPSFASSSSARSMTRWGFRPSTRCSPRQPRTAAS